MNILTWNINGIRSFKKDTLKHVLDSLDADVICLQETKVSRDMLDEATALVEGYTSYFGFCRKKCGYSGVVTYCKDTATPVRAEEGLSGVLSADSLDTIGCHGNAIAEHFSPQQLRDLDFEGRAVITQHEIMCEDASTALLSIINVYCPHVDPDKPERLTYKLDFFRLLQIRLQELRQTGSKVIIVGDLNISHRVIDHCDPDKSEMLYNEDPCRQWLTDLLNCSKPDGSMVDMFRRLHPTDDQAFTCWNTKTNARATNYGTRIDYILADASLASQVSACVIMDKVLGSDHSPVRAVIQPKPIAANRCPAFCSRYFPEFAGKQVKLTDFMSRKRKTETSVSDRELAGEEYVIGTGLKVAVVARREKRQRSLKSFFECTVQPVAALEPAVSGCSTSVCEASKRNVNAAGVLWKRLLTGPKPPPLCKVHQEPCVERSVLKKGPNFNRRFWVCSRGAGRVEDPQARCNHFEWKMKQQLQK